MAEGRCRCPAISLQCGAVLPGGLEQPASIWTRSRCS